MRNEFLYSASRIWTLREFVMLLDIFTGGRDILNRESKLDSWLRSLVRSRVDIERVLISEKRRDNDAHVIAHLHLCRIYILVSMRLSACFVDQESRKINPVPLLSTEKVYK